MKIRFLYLVLITLIGSSLHAQTLELEEINRNIRNEEAELLKLQSEKKNISKQIAVVSSKISNYRMLISQLNKERVKCENNVKEIRKNIKQTTKAIEANKRNIAKSNMYVVDNMGYADIKIITTTQKVEDTVKILELLGKAGKNLKKQIDKLNADILKLNQLKQEEEAKVYELDTLEKNRKKAIAELNAENKRYKSMITVIKHNEAGRKEYIELLKFQRSELDEQLQIWAEKESNKEISSLGSSAGNGKVRTFGEDKPVASAMADNSPFGKLVNKLPMPVMGRIIEEYGEHIVEDAGVKIMHKGIKISPSSTTTVKAVASGRVVFADNVKNFNNLVIIDHGYSYYTVYGNLDTLLVETGKKINQGDDLGDIIVDREVDNPYLYFELRKKDIALNPALWFKKG